MGEENRRMLTMTQINCIRKIFFEKGMNYAALCQYLAGIFFIVPAQIKTIKILTVKPPLAALDM
jgi:hypothetical protein